MGPSFPSPTFTFWFLVTISIISAQQNRNGALNPYGHSEGDVSSLCRQQKQCGLCHQVRGCVWCKDPKYIQDPKAGSYDRCNSRAGHTRGGCAQFEQKGVPSSQAGHVKDTPIQPSEYEATLWVDQKVNITFRYRDSGNKPLDLYYLMDLSQTMADDKDAVVELGRTFAAALQSTTTNLQMGFGSFVDKPLMPFASLSHIQTPERGLRSVYGFENRLPLTLVDPHDPLFEKTVRGAQISVNLDSPEGGLDAMMQVLQCWEQIGWRPNAHRILVVSTDGTFHIAGDGKLVGIVLPNDGKCHLDQNGLYTHSTILDYPSVAQIVAKIREKQIYVIFAVNKDVEILYQTLSKLVSDYAFTIKLDAKSRYVGQLVRDHYDKIKSTVELSSKPLVKDSDLGITYYVKCPRSANFIKGSKCSNLSPNEAVEFVAEFELKRCPAEYADKEWKQQIEITPTGSQDSLRVNLHLKCGCGCEQGGTSEGRRDALCNDRGSVECGICKCNKEFTGDYCQCQRSVEATGGDGTICDPPCGGQRGTCKCGQCECNDPFTGPSCQCNKHRCKCGAESRGKCVCEKSEEDCVCEEGWVTVREPNTAPCTCSTATDGCRKGSTGDLCSGHGNCVCNRCDKTCNPGFVGKYCDVCQDCKCLGEFAKCSVKRESRTVVGLKDVITGDGATGQSCAHASGIIGSKVNVTTYSNGTVAEELEGDETKCFTDLDGCKLVYIYGYNKFTQEVKVRIQQTLECPVPVNPLPIIFGTVMSVVILGILTLILWKLITYCIDRREFNKFEKECQDGKWEIGGNPLYKEVTTTFQNPAYTD